MPFQDLLNALGQKFQNNLQGTNQVIGDDTKMTLDRLKMENPNVAGPPLPQTQMPQEQQFNNMMMNGVMGAVSPGVKYPINTNIPSAGGNVLKSGSEMWKQMLETQIKNREADAANRLASQRFQSLKAKLGGQ